MIVGVGIDFIDHRRMEQELERGAWTVADGIFDAEEIAGADSARRPATRYAACFAAKEAILKALGLPVPDLAMFREVNLRPAADGGYGVVLQGRLERHARELRVRQINLSIAQTRKQTAAMVILDD